MSDPRAPSPPTDERALYALLQELDRCEDLLEEMDDLGVASRDDVERRMDALHARVDDLGGG